MTHVFNCGGVTTYQLLCGRDVAKDNRMAAQMANYMYFIINTHNRTAIIVDAAWDVEGLYALADNLGVQIRGVVYTHSHFDHCGGKIRGISLPGAREVESRGGHIWAGRLDIPQIQKQCNVGNISPLDDGDTIDCGDLVLHSVHTPGHTPGSICLFATPQCLSPRASIGTGPVQDIRSIDAESGLLITGDTLFIGSCGRTDLPGSDPHQMYTSLSRLSMMHPDVVVLPGHNYAPRAFSTIAMERSVNMMMELSISQVPAPPAVPPCCAADNRGSCGPRGFKVGRKVRIRNGSSKDQLAVLQQFHQDHQAYSVRPLNGGPAQLVEPDDLEHAQEKPAL